MESEKTKQPHEIISECVTNTVYQTEKNKEYRKDVEEFTNVFQNFCAKYGDQIAGFYILKFKGCSWMINIATDGEIE